MSRPGPLTILLTFLKLGCTGFGGPVAHIGHFHDALVRRAKWLSDGAYGDLVALCQFLPGPTSSQVGFGIGLLKGGPIGGLMAFIGFTLPSALIMIGAGYGALTLGGGPGVWIGLKLAAMAVVAMAVRDMAAGLCPDAPRRWLALGGAAGMLALGDAIWQIVLLLVGGLAGFVLKSGGDTPAEANGDFESPPRAAGYGALLLCAGLLAGLSAMAASGGAGRWRRRPFAPARWCSAAAMWCYRCSRTASSGRNG